MSKHKFTTPSRYALIAILMLAGCKDKKSESSDYPENQFRESSIGSVEANDTDDTEEPRDELATEPELEGTESENHQQMTRYMSGLRNTIASKRSLAGATETDLNEIRSSIQVIAANTGTDIPRVLTSLLKAYPEADALTTVIARLYPNDPEIAIEAYMKGIHGRTRSHALSAYASMLSRNNDIQGLQVMYERLPSSQDRAGVAAQYVNTAANSLGLSEAMTRLKSLDLREEQSISIRSLYPYVRQNRDSTSAEDLEHFYQLAGEFDNEQSARARTAE